MSASTEMTTETNSTSRPLLSIEDLKMYFPVLGGVMHRLQVSLAVEGVAVDINLGIQFLNCIKACPANLVLAIIISSLE